MKGTRVLGAAAVVAALMLAVPSEHAQAASLISPGAAAAVQDDSRSATTEVRWHRHWHHRWHRHHWRRWHHHRHW